MTAPLFAIAAVLLAFHLVRSRGHRHRRRHLAVQRRRAARERQWRAMIRDDGGDG